LSAVALDAGKLSLTAAGSEDFAFGILLDPQVDTTHAFSDGSVTGSIARAGSFQGEALIVASGTDAAKVTARLRYQGIYVNGAIVAPTTAEAIVPATTDEAPPPSRKGKPLRLSVSVALGGRYIRAGDELPPDLKVPQHPGVPGCTLNYRRGGGEGGVSRDLPSQEHFEKRKFHFKPLKTR
jgi:hypothetical protein